MPKKKLEKASKGMVRTDNERAVSNREEEMHHEEMDAWAPLYNYQFMKSLLQGAVPDPYGNKGVNVETTDPRFQHNFLNSSKELQPKLTKITGQTLRRTQEKSPVFTMILQARSHQYLQFNRESRNEADKGFTFRHVDKDRQLTNKDEKERDALIKWFLAMGDLTVEQRYKTGWKHMSEYSLEDIASSDVYDLLTLDANALYCSKNRKGDTTGFFPVDADTIWRVKNPFETTLLGRDDAVFAQMIEQKIVHAYGWNDMVYGYMNKRSDIRFAGYGYPIPEMAIDILIGIIFSFEYNMGYFSRSKMPPGIITVKGEQVNQASIRMIEAYLTSALSGIEGQHRIPILPAGKNSEIDFKKIRDSNKDMEWSDFMDKLHTILLGLCGMSPDELGLQLKGGQRAIIEDTEAKISASKDRGLGAMMSHFGRRNTKIIQRFNDQWECKWNGIEFPDRKRESEIAQGELSSFKTLREAMVEKDIPVKEFEDVVVSYATKGGGSKEISVLDIPAPFNQNWQQVLNNALNGDAGEGGAEEENGFGGFGGASEVNGKEDYESPEGSEDEYDIPPDEVNDMNEDQRIGAMGKRAKLPKKDIQKVQDLNKKLEEFKGVYLIS